MSQTVTLALCPVDDFVQHVCAGDSNNGARRVPEIDQPFLETKDGCAVRSTGKQKIMDVAGRVERFNRRYGKQGKTPASGDAAES